MAFSTEQVEQDLSRFIPDRKPIQKTWLNDRIILHLITELFRSEETTQVFDPVQINEAFQKQERKMLNVDSQSKLLIVPCHTTDHWSLIVINIEDKKIDIYNTNHEKSGRIAKFIATSLASDDKWVKKRASVRNPCPCQSNL